MTAVSPVPHHEKRSHSSNVGLLVNVSTPSHVATHTWLSQRTLAQARLVGGDLPTQVPTRDARLTVDAELGCGR